MCHYKLEMRANLYHAMFIYEYRSENLDELLPFRLLYKRPFIQLDTAPHVGMCIPTLVCERWRCSFGDWIFHYGDVIMSAIASQITSLMIVYSTVYSGADQRKHQSSASLVFVRGIHRWPVNSPHKGPVTRNMFPLDDVVICDAYLFWCILRFGCQFHIPYYPYLDRGVIMKICAKILKITK